MVIVMEGCKDDQITEELPYTVIQEKIQTYILEGYSTKEAIKKVAKDHGLSKNELYKQFHNN